MSREVCVHNKLLESECNECESEQLKAECDELREELTTCYDCKCETYCTYTICDNCETKRQTAMSQLAELRTAFDGYRQRTGKLQEELAVRVAEVKHLAGMLEKLTAEHDKSIGWGQAWRDRWHKLNPPRLVKRLPPDDWKEFEVGDE